MSAAETRNAGRSSAPCRRPNAVADVAAGPAPGYGAGSCQQPRTCLQPRPCAGPARTGQSTSVQHRAARLVYVSRREALEAAQRRVGGQTQPAASPQLSAGRRGGFMPAAENLAAAVMQSGQRASVQHRAASQVYAGRREALEAARLHPARRVGGSARTGRRAPCPGRRDPLEAALVHPGRQGRVLLPALGSRQPGRPRRHVTRPGTTVPPPSHLGSRGGLCYDFAN